MDKKGKSIQAKVGVVFALEVESNPTAGYQWVVEAPSDKVRIVEHQVSPGGAFGATAKERFIIEPLAPGDMLIRLQYKRSWEKEPLNEQEIRVHVK